MSAVLVHFLFCVLRKTQLVDRDTLLCFDIFRSQPITKTQDAPTMKLLFICVGSRGDAESGGEQERKDRAQAEE